jgi:SPP1 gp7 family putative phage head morphogenesis protein
MKIHLISPLLQQAAQKKRGRKPIAKPISRSKKVEIEYLSQLLKITRLCQHDIVESIIPILKQQQIGDSQNIQVSDGILDIFLSTVSALRSKMNGIVDTIAFDLARRVVEQNKANADKQLALIIYNSTGIDLSSLMSSEDLAEAVAEAIAANVALIKSIPNQHLDQVERIVLNGLQSGQRAESMVEDIKALGGKGEKRAALIARDQIGKITSRLTQIRQQKMGITHYYWSTSQDERVRHIHRARNGKLFAWNSPPDDGHPGIPIRCRCVAIPYIAHLFNPNAPTPEEIMELQMAA